MKKLLTLSALSLLSLPALAVDKWGLPEIECTMATPKWLGIGRLTQNLGGHGLVMYPENGRYTQDGVRKALRKTILAEHGLNNEVTFTFHPVFARQAKETVDSLESSTVFVSESFKQGVNFALLKIYHNQIVAPLKELDNADKIEITDEKLLSPISNSTFLNFNEIYSYMNYYYAGMTESVTIVADATDKKSEVFYDGSDSGSKRTIHVSNCHEINN